MIAEEQAFAKLDGLRQASDELGAWVHKAAKSGVPAHDAEKRILEEALKIGRLAMGCFLQLQGNGDQGEQVETPEGKILKRLEEPRRRPYLSIFGLYEIERVVYAVDERQKIEFVPLDARLALPESKFSYWLQDWDQMLGAEQPFQQISPFLERILGLKQHVDSLERMSRSLADDAEAFCWSQPPPPAEEEGELLVQTTDGKGVPMRRPADAAPIQDHEHRPGPKPDRKKVATLGSVYTVDRYVRTPEDILEALFRDPQDPDPQRPKRPRPCHKRVYAQLTQELGEGDVVDGSAAVFGWIDQQVRCRDPQGKKERVCLMDGQESLWSMKDTLQKGQPMTEILDLLHVTPRLWKAARLFEGQNTRRAERFVREYVAKILHGQVRSVVRGLRRMATVRRFSAARRSPLETICQYFETHQHRMRYDEYLRKGYPIASGVIEGACRHLVRDRLERTGMSWTIPGAQSMLLQRAIYINGLWDDFMRYRIERQTQRLYPNRSTISQIDWTLAI
jgi:hypothetical protein